MSSKRPRDEEEMVDLAATADGRARLGETELRELLEEHGVSGMDLEGPRDILLQRLEAAIAAGAEAEDDAVPDAKRARASGDAAAGPSGAPAAPDADGGADEDADEDEYRRHAPRLNKDVKTARDCPFLDTVNRAALDFDFEKCCSVTLSPHNCYCCLVCGKYFQGRGPATVAYTHSVEAGHHVFMNLSTGRVYCLPDGYEVADRSLDDIRFVLSPAFPPAAVAAVDSLRQWSRALDGTEYLPGVIGLNNLKATDYVNVVLTALMRVAPLRNFFLEPENYKGCQSLVVRRFGELCCKIWNPRNFKGQVSPHEFMQAVLQASGKRFRIDSQGDPVAFLMWLLHELHTQLGGGKRHGSSIVDRLMQGELRAVSVDDAGAEGKSERVPFYMLGLDLPPPPLFQDVMEKNIIPQVPLAQILSKFDGASLHDVLRQGRKKYSITRLPKFLILHMKRFTRNNFFVEKNPTIVTFQVKNLQLADFIPVPAGPDGKPVPSKYDLVANICHDGKPAAGTYRSQVYHRADGQWYDIQDLTVSEVLPQQVALAECFLQIYELKE